LFAFIIISLLKSEKLIASHSKGVDLTYNCLGDNKYDFLLTFYQDCSGDLNVLSEPPPVLLISSVKCGFFQEAVMTFLQQPVKYDTLLNEVTGEIISIEPSYEVTTLCKSLQSSCNGGSFDGVKKFTFGVEFTLPFQCDDWVIAYSNCCRNADITNLIAADLFEIYIEANINNTNGICNNSPTFSALAVPYFCVGQKGFYNHGVADIDNNTLRFSLINPLDAGGVPIQMRTQIGFSAETPVRTINDDFYMNPQTGQMQFTPAYTEKDALTVLVEEYDENGTFVGSVMRDMQMVLYDCTNQQSVLENNGIDLQTVENALFINEAKIESCPGNNIQFQLEVSDADVLDTLSFQTNLLEAIPGANFTKSGPNPLILTFNWTPTEVDIGEHNFVISFLDDFCPVPSNQTFGFAINITNGIELGDDIVKCDNNEIELSPNGGSEFLWSSDPFDNDIRLYNISAEDEVAFVNPTQNTIYIVESNMPVGCKNIDTIKIEIEEPLKYNLERDATACKGETTTLNITTQNINEDYNYSWYPADLLTDANTTSPTFIGLNDQTFYVDISSSSGCVVKDSVDFKVGGTLPEFSLIASETDICPGTPIIITVENECNFCQPDLGTVETADVSPFYIGNEYVKLQLLIRATELTTSGLQKGLIEQIGVTIPTKFSSEAYKNLQIAMGQTSIDELNSNIGFIKGLTTVMQPIDYKTVEGENIFLFDNDFYWNGIDNIVIEFCYDNNEIDPFPDRVLSTITNYTSCLTSSYSQAVSCNMTVEASHQMRPNIRFIKTELPEEEIAITWESFLASNDRTSATIIPYESAYYSVTVSSSNCTATDSIFINTLNQPTVDLGEDLAFASGETVQLNATGDFEDFEWLTTTGLSDASIINPIYNLEESATQIIEVEGSNGCTNTDTLQLTYLGCLVQVPTAFSPNSDGINDGLGPIYLDLNLVVNQFDIYNRYGQKVFQAKGNNIFWEGVYKNEKQPIGVYSYFLSFTCDNEVQQRKGNITLVR